MTFFKGVAFILANLRSLYI